MSDTALSVRLFERPVGLLKLHSGGMQFQYSQDTSRAISLSMPLREEPYRNRNCEAFFGGLLPDSPNARKQIARQVGANSNSSFSLLGQIGYDCAGAVSLCDPSEPISETTRFRLEGRELSDKVLYKHLNELPTHPLLAGVEGIRISLAGAQDKASLCMIDGKLCAPAPKVPTTHILKVPIHGLEATVENEYYCLSLARRAGIDAAEAEIKSIDDLMILLVKRYDRVYKSDATVSRIHQEDFCQALGVVSTKKYQVDGGPTLLDCFKLIEQVKQPAIDRLELLRRVLFNYLVGNCDCHAKNFSILHHENGQVSLAPAYDLICTSIYENTTRRFAMSIGKESELNSIRARNWDTFREGIGMTAVAFKKFSIEFAKVTARSAPKVADEMREHGLGIDLVNSVSGLVSKRADALVTLME